MGRTVRSTLSYKVIQTCPSLWFDGFSYDSRKGSRNHGRYMYFSRFPGEEEIKP